jgi:hypothetical protein
MLVLFFAFPASEQATFNCLTEKQLVSGLTATNYKELSLCFVDRQSKSKAQWKL